MRKIGSGILTLFLTLLLFTGCSTSGYEKSNGTVAPPTVTKSSSIESATESAVESGSSEAKDLSAGDYKDTGKGEFAISTPSGTSENGNVPIIFTDKNSVMGGLGIYVRKFDGAKLSYVYVDGKLIKKDQYADTDTSINLKSQNITAGTHKVEIAQYDTDSPDGKLITYKSASYEVKQK
jgi:hypothetical protein